MKEGLRTAWAIAPHRPRVSRPAAPSFWFSVTVNELPFLAMAWLVVGTLATAIDGSLDSPGVRGRWCRRARCRWIGGDRAARMEGGDRGPTGAARSGHRPAGPDSRRRGVGGRAAVSGPPDRVAVQRPAARSASGQGRRLRRGRPGDPTGSVPPQASDGYGSGPRLLPRGRIPRWEQVPRRGRRDRGVLQLRRPRRMNPRRLAGWLAVAIASAPARGWVCGVPSPRAACQQDDAVLRFSGLCPLSEWIGTRSTSPVPERGIGHSRVPRSAARPGNTRRDRRSAGRHLTE